MSEPTFNFARIGDQMIPGKLLVRATRTPWRFHNDIDLRLAVVDGAKVTVATNLILTTQDEGADFPPLMTMGSDMGQQLMDQLWECGLRPSEGAGSAGQMTAVQAHLNDMRRLVFQEPKP
jgi:hypothetical protein